MNRVKFYSTHDLSVSFYLERIEEVLARYDENEKIADFNDALELYNIQRFFENHIYSMDWTSQQKDAYMEAVKKFPKSLGKYLSEVAPQDICAAFDTIEARYVADFWQLLERYKVFDRMDSADFVELTQKAHFVLGNVLKCRQIVCRFSDEIIRYMDQKPETAELLVGYYLEKQEGIENLLYFPDGLTNEKKAAMLDAYIQTDPNPNYLKLIAESSGREGLPLPDRIKQSAKKKYRERIDSFFAGGGGFSYGVAVRFSKEQEDARKYEIQEIKGEMILSVTYSGKWIEENLDYPTLLNNFIYLFEYTDLQCRSLHVRTESQMGTIEKMLGIQGKREYHTGIRFNQIQMLAQLQMKAYCAQLEKCGVHLEEVFRWFFEEYLRDEFGAEGFHYHAASQGTSYLEKCRNIAPEIESVLKQFKLWCEEGRIDRELLQIGTEHLFIKDVPSLQKRKYVYPCGDEYRTITNLLFSDQSLICRIPDFEEKCDSFDSLLRKRSVYYDAFLEYQKPYIDELLDFGVIKRDAEGRITPCSDKVTILRQLYQYDVFCYAYAGKYRSVIEELENRGVIRFGASLLSKPEQDYFNYLMNKSKFDNGLDIRNRYIHGTQSDSASENEEDYYHLLRIMVLIIIKINEEFCPAASSVRR